MNKSAIALDGFEAEFGDLANATRLVEAYGDDLLYCAALGGWHCWDGRRYKRCANGEELLAAQHVARLLMAEAVAVLSTAEAAKAQGELGAARWRVSSAAKVQSAGRLRAMLNVAAPRLAVDAAELDADPRDFELTERAAMEEGCLEYQRPGLAEPQAVCAATANYRHDEDALADWLERYCEVGANLAEPQKRLHDSYTSHQEAEGAKRTMAAQTFGRLLERRGFAKGSRRIKSSRVRVGLRLLTPVERAQRDRWGSEGR